MSIKRLIGLLAVYCLTCIAWLSLAGVTHERSHEQAALLRDQVSNLWGEPQEQRAPTVGFRAVVPSEQNVPDSVVIANEEVEELGLSFPEPVEEKSDTKGTGQHASGHKAATKPEEPKTRWVLRRQPMSVSLDGSDIDTTLHSDPRRKGLVWYALYDVDFTGKYVYEHRGSESGYLDIVFHLPTANALYDQLFFEVNGDDRRAALDPATGDFSLSIPVRPGDRVAFSAGYKSRGSETWHYIPGASAQRLENFHLTMNTDFRDIDFPGQTVSPTQKQLTDSGYELTWDFASTVTGQGMGMILPQHIQPGELSTALTLSAPISLLFFFLMLFVLATLRKLDIHPINYLFLAAAFFAFHLLFAYSADILTVPWAFGLSSVVSLLLVVTYLRLVVSPKFALREAAAGQLIYLIGFSLAHFCEGYTGLTITVLAIVTLFLLMQATARLKWSEVLGGNGASSSREPQVA